MARGYVRGGARTTYPLAAVPISWIAMGFVSSLILAGNAHGQDLVPAPPDFKPDVSPVIVTPPPAPVDDSPIDLSPPAPGPSNLNDEIHHRFGAPAAPSFAGDFVAERLERAGAKAKEGKYVEALDEVELVLSQDPTNSKALLLRTLCRIGLGLPLDDAFLAAELHAVDECVMADGTNSVWRAIRGILLNYNGDPRRAVAELTYAIERRSGMAGWYYHRGLARMQMEEYTQAISDLSLAATRCTPGQVPLQILTERARCFLRCGDFDRAIADLTVAIGRHPKEYAPYELRSDAYLEKKDTNRALADYEQVVKLRPNDSMVWVRCAILRFRNGDGAGALSDMNRAVKLDPQRAGVYFLRGVLRFLIDGVGDQVLADADRAVALAPGDPFLYACRGILRAKDLRCVPAFNDFVTCFLLRKRVELRLYGNIDHARGGFKVGINWTIKESENQPKPRILASTSDRQCIDLAMQHLVAATWGGGK